MDESFDWFSPDDGEEVIWAGKQHPYSLVPAFVVGIPLTLVVVGLVIMVSAYLSYQNTNYVVTNDALYKKTGVLSRNVQRIEFDKVQDTSYRQSFFGAQFGYGTVDISTAGGSGVEMSFDNVDAPRDLQSLINERNKKRGTGTDTEGDKNAVLGEILAELRAIRDAVENDGEPSNANADGDWSEPEDDRL
ncbi:PH domain-containing protein [Haladaptatus pallidirubidus]|uniref:YdbS-like PH domain-containing protein n=1 Tax=Haladaptatus pallidirubidus TaxID=1008152 RepID=A0AAV3UK85_9EURY|nr:PH domain-containing protein [Haladaptatus pallidirubidus]